MHAVQKLFSINLYNFIIFHVTKLQSNPHLSIAALRQYIGNPFHYEKSTLVRLRDLNEECPQTSFILATIIFKKLFTRCSSWVHFVLRTVLYSVGRIFRNVLLLVTVTGISSVTLVSKYLYTPGEVL